MVWLHPRFIYPFSQEQFAHPGFERVLVPSGSETIAVYLAKAPTDLPPIVYFMGNAGALAPFISILDFHRNQGRSVVAMTFRGGGGEPGVPSEAALKADALAVLDALPDLGFSFPPIVHGYSLGSGLALHVAANRPVHSVLLTAPYDRMCTLMAAASWLPACILPGVQAWKSDRLAASVTAPVTILHGDEDALIPAERSARLEHVLKGSGVTIRREIVAGAGHADLMEWPAYTMALDAFLRSEP